VKSVIDLVRSLYPHAYSVVSEGSDQALPAFCSELPFEVTEYASGSEINGWIVPPAWRVLHARLYRDGSLVYDATSSPLGVAALSPSMTGRFTLEQLRSHLFCSEVEPDAVPYHWTNLYRPSNRQWGLCIPKNLLASLPDTGVYEIDIATESRPGTMKVLDYLLTGEDPRAILLNAHNCHPFQANDDISGCAVGIRVMQRLSERRNRRFNYRLVIAPELIGTVHWLHKLGQHARQLAFAIMLKSIGNDAPLKLQESFSGASAIDRAAHHVFKHRFGTYDSGAFRTVYGNDETVFDSPGYAIPSISLTRVPFSQYHTDADTPASLSAAALDESTDTVLEILDAMELDRAYRANFTGLIALSHPRYDLYRPAPAPGIDQHGRTATERAWHHLMTCLPRYFDGNTSLLQIADRHQLPIREVAVYVGQWVAKGLASPVAMT
jgi:aminopeptidase-like protein